MRHMGEFKPEVYPGGLTEEDAKNPDEGRSGARRRVHG